MLTDPISDMLTRIRNAQMAKFDEVRIPHSKMKERIGKILVDEGFVSDLKVEGETKKTITIRLKYVNRVPVIERLTRISRPGRRIYVDADNVPMIQAGLGVAILSTSSGVMVDREARRQHVGGEVLCHIW